MSDGAGLNGTDRGTGRARRSITVPFAVFTVIMVLVMVFPVYGLGNRVEPFVMGLPFSLFWVLAWIGVEFVALIAFYLFEYGFSADDGDA